MGRIARRPVGLALPVGVIKNVVPRAEPLLERHFELGEILGQGASSTVRRVSKRGNHATPGGGLLVAKTYRTNDEEIVNVAKREFQILKLLGSHPNVMTCEDIVVDSPRGRVDLVLHEAPGISLTRLVSDDGPLSEDRARPILIGLLKALLRCHSRRVVHRDVKADNILVNEEDNGGVGVVLCDFNTAYCLGKDCDDSLAGGATPTGTVDWLSPECANNDCTGEMVDVWAAGLCLYYMLAGSLPWRSMLDVVKSAEDIEPPPGISEEAMDLLRSLLQRDVESRMLVCGALAHPWCKLSHETLDELFFAGVDADQDDPCSKRVSFRMAATGRHCNKEPGLDKFGMISAEDPGCDGCEQVNGLSEDSSVCTEARIPSQEEHGKRFKRNKTIHASGGCRLASLMH